MTTETKSSVLRARIGVQSPATLARGDLEDRLVEAIAAAVVLRRP
jgi:hypothetical protein